MENAALEILNEDIEDTTKMYALFFLNVAYIGSGAGKTFDFSELLEFIFLLQSNAGATKFLQNAFGLSAPQAKALSAEVANLSSAHAVSKNFDNAKSGAQKLRVRQFWREKGKF